MVCLIVLLEVVALYVIYWYGNEPEVYILMFAVSTSLILIMVGDSGLISVLVLVLMWPGYLCYVVWMAGVMEGLKIMASTNKVMDVLLVLSVGFVLNGVLYFIVLSGAISGVMGVVSLSFYVYYLLGSGIWFLVLGFYLLNLSVNVTYNALVLGVLPLPLFFLKVGSMICLYGVMLLSAIILLEG